MSTLVIFVVQLFLFAGIAIALHRYSHRFGMTPLIFFVAGVVGVLNIIELNALTIQVTESLEIRPGGHVYVPLVLLIVLILYVTNGTRPAQITVYGITGINALVLLVLGFLMLYLEFYDPETVIRGGMAERDVLTPEFLRGVFASLVAFFADMYILIIVYQGMLNAFKWMPRWLIPTVSLVVAMWTDTVVYNILALIGTERFMFQLSGDVVMKTVAAILLSIPTAYYLLRVAPGLPDFVGAEGRSVFDILFSDSGKFSRAVKSLESELFISRSTYNQITANIEGIFWLADVKTRRIIYLSPAFEHITGYKAERYYKSADALLEIIHPDDIDTSYQGGVIDFLVQTPEIEFRIQRPDKMIRWLRNRSFPIKDDNSMIVRYAGIVEDITVVRRATEQAFELAVTREKMSYLHDFVRDASHDLKTPITAMLIKLDLLERTTDQERRIRLGKEIRARARHLTRLIDDLFTLSRIESRRHLTMKPFDFSHVVSDVIERYRPIAEEKSLTIHTAIDHGSGQIMGDADQLERVVMNLISNAIRYTQEGAIHVHLWLDENDQSTLCLSVKDSGIGIESSEVSRVFDRFYRSSNARDSNREGTGLGLAITKAIVEQHRGVIDIESVIDEGTTFTVLLPVHADLSRDEEKLTTDERRAMQEFRPVKD